jgi:flagellar hook assembly protein FlgD
VFNSRGKKVVSLLNREQLAGEHFGRWDGKNDDGISMTSGVNFYRMRTSSTDQIRKMVLLKLDLTYNANSR